MQNIDIAAALDEVADLLEIQGANPFRARAYRNAARVITGRSEPLARMVAEGAKLTDLPAIGKDMATYIEELVTTERLGLLEELRQQVPTTLLAFLKLPGVGPKRAAQMWHDLGLHTLDDLEAACRDGRVSALRGFGERSQAKVLAALAELKAVPGRIPLQEADALAASLREHMARAPGLVQLEIAGSWRRRKETVGDLDVLATATSPGLVMAHLTSWPEVARVDAAGPTRATVRLKSGLQVDLRVVAPESLGAALAYFTGSKAHNIRVRKRALDRGLRLSEYGLFPREGGPAVAGATEAEVYAAVDLPWIPPELREDRGEIEAAEAGELPELVTLADLRGDLLVHPTDLEAMVAACEARGYDYVGVTGAHRVRARIRVLRVAEVVDLDDARLEKLDFVIAKPRAKDILRALAHPLVDAWVQPPGDIDVDEVLACAREHEVALCVGGDDVLARSAREHGVRLVLCSGARTVEELDWIRYGLDQARRAWARREDVLNTGPLPERLLVT